MHKYSHSSMISNILILSCILHTNQNELVYHLMNNEMSNKNIWYRNLHRLVATYHSFKTFKMLVNVLLQFSLFVSQDSIYLNYSSSQGGNNRWITNPLNDKYFISVISFS